MELRLELNTPVIIQFSNGETTVGWKGLSNANEKLLFWVELLNQEHIHTLADMVQL
jgi:hypothetical protein